MVPNNETSYPVFFTEDEVTSPAIVANNRFNGCTEICIEMEPYVLDSYTAMVQDMFLNCFLINAISIFGIIGNCINIAVLRQHGFQESTNIILVSLSTSDLIFSFTAPVSRLRCLVSHFDHTMALSVHTIVTVASFMPKFACLATSFAYVAVISIERFTAVFFPFHVSKVFNKRLTKFLVLIIPAAVVLAMIPTFRALTYEWIFDQELNATIAVLRYTSYYLQNQRFVDVYAWVGLNNFFCGSSISIVIFCCLAIGLKLTHVAIQREQLTNRTSGYDVKVVKMLVTVCIVYLFVSIPTITLYSFFLPNFILHSPFYELIDNICVVLYCCNASCNFIVYVTMSRKFANTYKKLLTCPKSPK